METSKQTFDDMDVCIMTNRDNTALSEVEGKDGESAWEASVHPNRCGYPRFGERLSGSGGTKEEARKELFRIVSDAAHRVNKAPPNDNGPGVLVGYLRRERTHFQTPTGDEVNFRVRGEYRVAHMEDDVFVEIRESLQDRSVYIPDGHPACPDCEEGEVMWAEAGRVPGSRECVDCGSCFVDTRYGVASPVPSRNPDREVEDAQAPGF